MIAIVLALAFAVSAPEVEIVPIFHASFILKWQGKVLQVDPWSQGDFEGQPKADLILLTDIHSDHLDLKQIAANSKPETIIVGPQAVQASVAEARVLNNGESADLLGMRIEALPAYNLTRGPGPGRFYHTKGRGNGYLLTIGEKHIYISGDTECIPEIQGLKDIDIAFICMNLPYTMSVEEAAACINKIQPKVVYPYHYRGSDLEQLKKLVTAPGVEVRIVDWYKPKAGQD